LFVPSAQGHDVATLQLQSNKVHEFFFLFLFWKVKVHRLFQHTVSMVTTAIDDVMCPRLRVRMFTWEICVNIYLSRCRRRCLNIPKDISFISFHVHNFTTDVNHILCTLFNYHFGFITSTDSLIFFLLLLLPPSKNVSICRIHHEYR
jgi:hypothetical protein